MKRSIHPFVWVAAAVLAVMLAWEVISLRRGPDETEPLRDRLRELRAAADSCQASLAGDRLRLEAYDAHLDTLRERVRDLERMDPRGVPADSYQTYLRAFDQYNDSVAGWTARADTVRARWGRCRAVTEEHNALADSVRQMLIRQLEEAEGRR